MAIPIQKGDLIYGDYVVTELLRSNPVYQWTRALQRGSERSVVLQLLSPNTPSIQIAALLEYFDAVQGIRRKGLIAPEQTLSDRTYPLILQYPALTLEPLDAALALSPERALALWKQVCEALFILRNRSLCYGGFTSDSLVLLEGSACLTEFGYAPLIAAGNADALSLCRPFLAPEAVARHEVTSAGDLYALTVRIAEWKPELRQTDWYRQGTHSDPSGRFRDARALYDALEAALAAPRTGAAPPDTPPTTPPADSDSHLVPVNPVTEFHLTGYVSPAEAGEILGLGRYAAGTKVSVEAKAHRGWSFIEWCGDVNGTQSAREITLERGKTVVAHFERDLTPRRDAGGWWNQSAG